jgi:hypothetical protein
MHFSGMQERHIPAKKYKLSDQIYHQIFSYTAALQQQHTFGTRIPVASVLDENSAQRLYPFVP